MNETLLLGICLIVATFFIFFLLILYSFEIAKNDKKDYWSYSDRVRKSHISYAKYLRRLCIKFYGIKFLFYKPLVQIGLICSLLEVLEDFKRGKYKE